MDITYFDDDYIAQNFYVYTANAVIGLSTYLVNGYVDPNYFDDRNSQATLVCVAEKIKPAAADLVVVANTSIQGTKDARTDVTLTTISNLSCQADRIRESDSSLTVQTSLSATASRTRNLIPQLESISVQISAAVRNATGTITIETRSTVAVIPGRIRDYTPASNNGLYPISVSGNYPQIYPDNISGSFGAETISVWVKRDTSSSEGEILYAGTPSSNTGFINYNSAGTITMADQGFSSLEAITWNAAMPADTDWHHLFFKYRANLGGFYGDGYQLFIDGVSKGSREFQSVSAGILSFTGPYGNSIGPGHHLAQLRIGGAIELHEVYDGGYIDLGENGRGSFDQLPLPGIFSNLHRPWTNVAYLQVYLPQYLSSTASAIQPVPGLQVSSILQAEAISVLVTEANMSAVTTVAVTATIVKRIDLTLSASSTLTALAILNPGVIASLAAGAATLSTVVERIRTVESVLASQTVITASYNSFRQGQALLAVETATQTVIEKLRSFSAALVTQTLLAVTVNRLRNFSSDTLIDTELVAQVGEIVTFSADVDTEVLCGLDTTNTRIRTLVIDLQTLQVVSAEVNRLRPIQIAAVSDTVLACSADVVRTGESVLEAQFTVQADAQRVAFASAHLQTQQFVLYAIEIINIAEELTYVVESESRTRRVTRESLVYVLDSESRSRIIPAESRIYSIESADGVNII